FPAPRSPWRLTRSPAASAWPNTWPSRWVSAGLYVRTFAIAAAVAIVPGRRPPENINSVRGTSCQPCGSTTPHRFALQRFGRPPAALRLRRARSSPRCLARRHPVSQNHSAAAPSSLHLPVCAAVRERAAFPPPPPGGRRPAAPGGPRPPASIGPRPPASVGPRPPASVGLQSLDHCFTPCGWPRGEWEGGSFSPGNPRAFQEFPRRRRLLYPTNAQLEPAHTE